MLLSDAVLVDSQVVLALQEVWKNPQLSGVVSHLFLDDSLYSHSLQVSKLATQLAITMDLSEDMIHKVCVAGLLHDIGKTDIPYNILYKVGSLTDEEFEVVKKHSVYGYNYLKVSGVDNDICNMVLRHHEKRSGQGYPDGITDKSIAEEIITVADIFSALAEKRTYHEALSVREALNFISSFNDLDENVLTALQVGIDVK